MITTPIKNRVLCFIGAGRLDSALIELKALLKSSPHANEIFMHSGRHAYLKESVRKGIISYEESMIERNKITLSILELIEEIETAQQTNIQLEAELKAFNYLISSNEKLEQEYKSLKEEIKTLEAEKIKLLINSARHQGKIEQLEKQVHDLRLQLHEVIEQNAILKIQYQKEIEEIQKKILEDNNIDSSKFEISNLLKAGKIDEARKLLKESAEKSELDARKKVKESAATYYELAKLDELEFRYSDAVTNFQKSYDLQPDNPFYQLKLGSILSDLGFYIEAEKILTKKIVLPKNLPEWQGKFLALYFNNIGEVKRNIGDIDGAIKLLSDAYVLLLSSGMNESQPLFSIMNNLGLSYLDKGEFESAVDIFNKAMARLNPDSIEDFTNIARTHNNLAETYRGSLIEPKPFLDSKLLPQDRFELAANHGIKALEFGKKAHGETHIQLAYYYNTAGLIWLDARQLELSGSLFTSSLIISEKIFKLNHPIAGIALSNLASCNFALGRLDVAIDNLQTAKKIMLNFQPENSPTILNIDSSIEIITKELNKNK